MNALLRSTTIAIMLVFATAIALLVSAQTGQAAPEADVRVEPAAFPTPQPVVVDGVLDEWDRRGALRIESAAQRNLSDGQALSTHWQGPADASATIYLAYDRRALYIGGEVRDDRRRIDDQIWWLGDCLELFLDLDREGDRARWTWSDDDWQICLMPFASGRPWGVSMQGRNALLSDGDLKGIEVRGRPTDAAGYTFEARIPFANFPEFDPAADSIGFNFAVNDHDELDDGTRRQSYLTLNGRSHNYADTRNLSELTFVGDPPAEAGAVATRWDVVRPWLQALVPALLLILFAAWASRPLYEWVDRHLRSWRRIGVALLALLVFLVLGAPLVVSRWLEHRVVERFEPATRALARVAADLGEEFARHQGRGLDDPQAVIDLLRGRAVETRPHLVPVGVPLRPAGSRPNERTSVEGVPVLQYGFPTAVRTQLSFPLPAPTFLSRIHVFGAARFDDRVRPPGATPVAEDALELGVRLADGTERVESFPLVDRSEVTSTIDPGARVRRAWGEDGRPVDQFFVSGSVVEDMLVEAILVTPKDHAVHFELHGVTFAERDSPDTMIPLMLLRTAENGAPVGLWDGGIPAAAPVTVLAGATHEVALEPSSLDALWLFYATEDQSVLDPSRSGLEVARFRVRGPGGTERVIPVRSGVNIWHARFDRAKRPETMESEPAFPWNPGGGAPRWVESLEIDLSDGDETPVISSIRLENEGLTSVTWFAATGARRSEVARGAGSVLIESGRTVRVRSDVVDAIGPLGFAIFVDGTVVAADLGDREQSASLIGRPYPLGGDPASAEDDGRHSATLFGERALVRNMPISGDPRVGMTVAAVAPIEGLASLSRARRKAAIAGLLLIIPLLLFYVIDFATGIARLRLRLTTLLVATSLLPIVILFSVLYNVVAADRTRLREARATAALTQVQGRLDELLRTVQRVSREVIRSDVVRDVADREDLDDARLRAYLGEIVQLQDRPSLDLALRLEIEGPDGLIRRFHDAEDSAAASRFDLAEGGVRAHWSRLALVWSDDRRGRVNRVRVTAAGEATRALVTELTATLGLDLDLLTLDGFPLVAGRGDASPASELDVSSIRERSRPTFRSTAEGRLLASTLLRGPDDSPFGVARVTLSEDPSLLEVSTLSLQLESFFLWFCALALAAAVFLATVATRRIAAPVEALEEAARRVAEGELDVTVPADERGEVGRLAGSFNVMTARLRARAGERDRLDRAAALLGARVDLEATAKAGLAALSEDPPCLGGAVYLLAPEDDTASRVAVEGDGTRFPASLPRSSTLFKLDEPAHAELPGCSGEVLVLPLRRSRQSAGVVVLDHGSPEVASRVDGLLPLLRNVAGQLAVSLESARLYRLAVVDPATGVYVQSYVEGRLAEELDRAQHGQEMVAIVRVNLPRAALDGLRSASREMQLVGRRGDGFLVVMPRAGAGEVSAFLERMAREIRRHEGTDGGESILRHVHAASAIFPEDGESRSFLLDVVERRLAASHRDRIEQTALADSDRALETYDLGPYVFRSPRVHELLRDLARVAPSRASVLLLGETGVGKEVFADLLHRWSDRAAASFVAINCSAVPEPLLEAELFGHERGAFTGADRSRAGRLEEADGGTIFLDEIGDMPLSVQAKLLRVLQDQRIVRLGAHRAIEVDLRIVAATNRDLSKMIDAGTFRQDLYFRLKVVSLEIPPLRERKEDIPPLVEHCVSRYREEAGGVARTFSPAALDALHRHDWPGNVREMINVVRRALILAQSGTVLPSDLQFDDTGVREPIPSSPTRVVAPAEGDLNERQKRLLGRLEPGETIRSRDYFELVGVSPRTGLRDLNDLLSRGLLERLGRRRAATYRLAASQPQP